MNDWDKQELYLQGAETYYYLNQVHHSSVNTKRLFICGFDQVSLQLFPLSTCRVVRVSWRRNRTNTTSGFWFSALRPSAFMLTRSLLSGPSCPLFCTLATSASAHMRCVYEFTQVSHIKHWCHISVVVVLEWVFWGGPYLRWGRGQAGRLIVTDLLWGPADRHHAQSHSQ